MSSSRPGTCQDGGDAAGLRHPPSKEPRCPPTYGRGLKACVVGAGVIGLSTAEAIVRDGRFDSVTVFADKLTPCTTSDGAGAIWYPYAVGKTPPALINKWGIQTLERYEEILGARQAHEAGIAWTSGVCKGDVPILHHREPWAAHLPVYRNALEEERKLTSKTAPYGAWFRTIIANSPVYLAWLLKRLEGRGVTVVMRHVSVLDDLLADFDVVINCTGLGAREVAGDASVVGVRGQTVKVELKGGQDTFNTHIDDLSYTLPRPWCNTVVFGGTNEPGNESVVPNVDQTAEILKNCLDNLGRPASDVTVTGIWVGLRPVREAGIRLEALVLQSGQVLLHNYGHGGSGHTLHYGCALEASALLRKALDVRHGVLKDHGETAPGIRSTKVGEPVAVVVPRPTGYGVEVQAPDSEAPRPRL